MGWKDLSYWVRGGIIIAGITTLISLLLGTVISGLLFPLADYFLDQFSLFGSPTLFATLIAYFINGFFYGALMGWIYGKIKPKNGQ